MDKLSETEAAALREALDDEYRALATYDGVLADFGPVRPFANIRQAEARHIAALSGLFARYDLPLPRNRWPGKVQRFSSLRAACQAGLDAEIENARLYDRLLACAEHADVRTVFRRLKEASQLRHLPAFRRCLARRSLERAPAAQVTPLHTSRRAGPARYRWRRRKRAQTADR